MHLQKTSACRDDADGAGGKRKQQHVTVH